MSISKTYHPKEAEDKWYSYWLEHKFFRSVPDEREPYTIVIPPPNVTGVLHMGHMLNNTIQDVLIRRARMKGKNACWVPGTDHASIATEAKVVAMLKEEGHTKESLGREKFLERAMDWKEKYGGIILEQLKKLGASCDWDRTKFTMDNDMSDAVIDTFIHLYNKDLIYRGIRMVNWDPQGKTAVSDEEVIRKEVNQKLYYIKYFLLGTGTAKNANHKGEDPNYIVVATTRPETIMADAAICVNPNDPHYTHFHGRQVLIPLIDKAIDIITDEYVDMDFGTGALKVTPAHDLNDYELGQKHGLQVLDILNDDGTLNPLAQIYVGEDRFAVRKKIAIELQQNGYIDKIEDYKSQIGFSERTDAVIEPRLSMQWFCKMDEMAKPALDYVLKGDIKLIPEKFINTYKYWMENVRDWCISRQLWWGQRIPVWYGIKLGGKWKLGDPIPNDISNLNKDTSLFHIEVAKNEVEARKIFKTYYQKRNCSDNQIEQLLNAIHQEKDVVDTWFSSWLWPISVFDGFKDPNNDDINYYYPTNDLVTAPEILFFWVARMIMAGHEFRGELPFRNVYLTGIVRDKLGRKMSKSLGNSPDPLGLIEKYGADGVRVGMLLSSPAGNDLMFDESHCEQGRNFFNKVWNAFRLVKGWQVDDMLENPNQVAIGWFKSRFSQALAEIESNFAQFRLSEALMATYKLVWDDFCAWYLEMIKPAYEHPIDRETYEQTIAFFEKVLKILHPFMPFITEELWHDELFGERGEMDCCIVAQLPGIEQINTQLLNETEIVKQVITDIRNIRNSKQISPKEALALSIKTNSGIDYNQYKTIICKLGNIDGFDIVNDKVSGAASFMVSKDEFYIPLTENIDPVAETERLHKELEYLHGFLRSVEAKLGNERFMKNAKPEIIENELKKKADAETKLKIINDSLASLAN
ncbi:MAG: valine--tRNA ligase [Mucilaginibacter sp.]|nr:valine--tRNA ligase [Mucilaginibacter sp.]